MQVEVFVVEAEEVFQFGLLPDCICAESEVIGVFGVVFILLENGGWRSCSLLAFLPSLDKELELTLLPLFIIFK